MQSSPVAPAEKSARTYRVRSDQRRRSVPIHPILAHQYGWDEALLFIVPIAIAVIVVRRLDKRSRRKEEPESEKDGETRHET